MSMIVAPMMNTDTMAGLQIKALAFFQSLLEHFSHLYIFVLMT